MNDRIADDESVINIVVRSTAIDVNGHVNNAKYLEYLEWGREDWYEQSGLYYDVLLQMNVQTVTVNININYRKECRQGEKLSIRTNAEKAGRSSYVLKQQILNEQGQLCADALVTCVTINVQTRESTPMPDQLRKAFSS